MAIPEKKQKTQKKILIKCYKIPKKQKNTKNRKKTKKLKNYRIDGKSNVVGFFLLLTLTNKQDKIIISAYVKSTIVCFVSTLSCNVSMSFFYMHKSSPTYI